MTVELKMRMFLSKSSVFFTELFRGLISVWKLRGTGTLTNLDLSPQAVYLYLNTHPIGMLERHKDSSIVRFGERIG